MEVITFEAKAYKELMAKLDKIAGYVVNVETPASEQDEDQWLDSQEVCDLLRICRRTLQRLRKEQLISYSLLRGRCLYRRSDIEKAIRDKVISASPTTLEEFRRNYYLKNK